MRDWTPKRIARAAGGSGPERAVIDSREAGPGTLFAGLRGERADGGEFAGEALAAGAWGVLVGQTHAEAALAQGGGAVLAADDPLSALQALANAWRQQLGAQVIGVTGSTGKTSTKDLLVAAREAHPRTVASRGHL